MNKKLAVLLFLVSLISFLNSQTYVAPGEGTLSAAITGAADGDVLLLVPEAEYTETALSVLGTIVGKNLTIAADGEGKAFIKILKDLPADSLVFFRLGDQASLKLQGLDIDGNSKVKYLASLYMPESGVATTVKKIQIENCYVHDLYPDYESHVLSGGSSKFAGYLVADSTIINNSVFHRTSTIVYYKYNGSNYISLTNSTFAACYCYGVRISGVGTTLLAQNTPKVIIDHTTWFNIGTKEPREILVGDAPPLLRPWTVTNSIFVKQVATGNTRVFINIKDNTTSGESYLGTITNICYWEIDKIAFYMHSVLDTIRMDPQFADTANYDFTLPAGSPLLTYGTDGKPIGDPRWGTNYVDAIKPQKSPTPTHFVLGPVYPNPFNPSTTLTFSLPTNGWTNLTIFDLRGKVVGRVVNEYLAAGDYRFTFDGSHLESGIYFCRLTTAGNSSTRKMVLMK